MKIKPLSQNKKDYKNICGIFKAKLPHPLFNQHGGTCKNGYKATGFLCRKCKAYSAWAILGIDEAHENKDVKLDALIEHYASKKPPKVLYLCNRKKCETCSFPECAHTTDIKHAKNFKFEGSGTFIEVERDGVPIISFAARAEFEALQARLRHLLTSETISKYDMHDRKTHTYKYDVSTFDEEYNRYKAAYDIMQNAPSCHTCIKQRDCEYIKMGDHVVYNCPHYKETLKY